MDKICPDCNGEGIIDILKNNKPTGWFEGCDKCHSTGTIPEDWKLERKSQDTTEKDIFESMNKELDSILDPVEDDSSYRPEQP